MGNFDRNRGGRSGGFSRDRNFSRDRDMHRAVCDKCGKNCEVPFRPTSGKPIFCSDCFENNRNSDQRESGRNFAETRFEEKRMFDAKCDDCGNNCKLPFQPRGDKPVYCNNCFENKNGGGRNSGSYQNTSVNDNKKFDQLNAKLDAILKILTPLVPEETSEKFVEEVSEEPAEQVIEQVEVKEKKPKKASRKKV